MNFADECKGTPRVAAHEAPGRRHSSAGSRINISPLGFIMARLLFWSRTELEVRIAGLLAVLTGQFHGAGVQTCTLSMGQKGGVTEDHGLKDLVD
ncbi:hypothetical protein JOQ06_019607 [Pogonophryne albipinna]|uniref:Uncharacterized protein n=1 Tax=Pogonophryne albipinna TaxID=1090488 RepID=A0AAD6FUT2_9TELE|nr:hypothetical protein JOQ06_019607 [Pogonophryne albipinna]